MAWIPYRDGDDAPKGLLDIYRAITPKSQHDRLDELDNILRIHSLNPPSLSGHYELYKTLMRGHSALTRAEREMIAVVVSGINECHY